MKRFANLILASSLLAINLFLVVPTSQAGAHGNEEEHAKETSSASSDEKTEQKQDAGKDEAYTFVTPEGGSLSVLTRRALQLYDEQREDVSLTPAAAIYAETNIVQEMGARLLEIGERVQVERPLLDEYVEKSKGLSKEKLAAWNVYASQADFALDGLKTEQQVVKDSKDSKDSDAKTDPSKDEDKDEETKNEDGTKKDENKDSENSANQSSTSTYWWLLGIAVLATIYYLLGKRKSSN